MGSIELIKDRTVYFQYYRDGFFMYQLDNNGMMFSVPVNEVTSCTLKPQDKAVYFMRWIMRAAAQQRLAETEYNTNTTTPVELVEPKLKAESVEYGV